MSQTLLRSPRASGSKNPLKPWRVEFWCPGKPSAQYVAKMEDALELYQRSHDAKRPVLSQDEKS